MKKLIRYRIPVSITFPVTHDRKGEPTYFVEKIKIALENERGSIFDLWAKIHTIRASELWVKRFEKINKGEAVLELYYWSGNPYNSKSVTICQLTKDDGIGIQELEFLNSNVYDPVSISTYLKVSELAKNDGLSLEDFKAWFRKYDISKPLFIIHFTKFRY